LTRSIPESLAVNHASLGQPPPVFSDETRIDEHEQFPQVRKLFFDAPVKMHFHPPKKTAAKKKPRTDIFAIDPGITLFYPQDPGKASVREGCSTGPGRFSDLLALSATFPFRSGRTVVRTMAERVPSSSRKGGDYSGGSVSGFARGSPLSPLRRLNLILKGMFMETKRRSQA
jgi:hypothetical protein